jgi:hypothetical protein
LLVSVSVLVGFGKDLVKRRNLRVKEKSERRKNSKRSQEEKTNPGKSVHKCNLEFTSSLLVYVPYPAVLTTSLP